jgi:hypothetical protein
LGGTGRRRGFLAVKERRGSPAQSAALRLGEFVQQRPMPLDNPRTGCFGLKRWFQLLRRESVGPQRELLFALHMHSKGTGVMLKPSLLLFPWVEFRVGVFQIGDREP